ncbi:MAG: autoinducer binding domain-containing protein [Hyphomicrobiaceae bacterium]
MQDKVECGRTVGKLVDDQVLDAILADPQLQAADKFPGYCKTNVEPLIWECNPTQIEDPHERDFFSLAADFGVTGGITIPIHQLSASTYGNLTLFFGKEAQFWRDDLQSSNSDIHVAALYLDARLSVLPEVELPNPKLSPRERDCLSLLARGYQTAQIADRLMLSDATVHEYIANARRKLKARTRSEAVARAVHLRLIAL